MEYLTYIRSSYLSRLAAAVSYARLFSGDKFCSVCLTPVYNFLFVNAEKKCVSINDRYSSPSPKRTLAPKDTSLIRAQLYGVKYQLTGSFVTLLVP